MCATKSRFPVKPIAARLSAIPTPIGNQFAPTRANRLPMYSQTECLEEIARSIPALSGALHTPDCAQSIYKQVIVLSQYTAEKLYREELSEVEQSFCLADNLYQNGNSMVKSAIENVFVYALTSALGGARDKRKTIISLIPITLFTLYMKQVLHRGC